MSAQSAVSGTSQIHLEMAEQSCRCVSANPATWFRVTRSRSQVDGPPFRAAPRPSRFPLQMPPLCSEAGVAVLPPVDSTMRQYLQFRRWKPCAVNHWNGKRRTSLLSGSTSLRLTPKPVREWLQTRVLKQKADCDELGNDDINYPTLFSVGWFCLCRWAVAPERKNCFLGKPQVTHLPMEDVANHFNLTWPHL